ncbi:hypothetical protein [Vibrio owensii]|uniref:hypothetical protein n=1 Tax=Vibrio harveyi group TaxID=717610 RepID=UPI003CC6AD01
MKITELLQMEDNQRPSRVFGVECDDFLDVPLHGISEIGLLVEQEGDSLSFDVLDTAITISEVEGVQVILEVPFDCQIEPEEMILNAMNSGCDVSLLPPEDCTEELWDQFADRMIAYYNAWIEQARNDKMVYPVSGYLQYLMMQENGYMPDSIATDEYMKEQFVDGVDVEIMDKAKDRLREVIYESFGGYEGFKQYVNSLNVAVAKTIIKEAE